MNTQRAEMELRSALLGTGQVQPVESRHGTGFVEVLSRQVPGQEQAWLRTAEAMLLAFKDQPGEFHLCRRYVLRGDQMVYGWHLGLHVPASRLTQILSRLRPVLEAATPRLGDPVAAAPAPVTAPAGAGGQPRTVPRGTGGPPIRVVRDEITDAGEHIVEEEMALPHVTRDLAAPARPGAAGAVMTPSRGDSRGT